jgi:excinuclease ABC subunit C
MIDKKIIDSLPSQIGVYLIKKDRRVLYVGKSLNIKARIKNHLEQAKINSKERNLFDQANDIKYYLFDSDFHTSLKEAELIKQYQPKYNVRWKDDKNFLYIKITNDSLYPKVLLVRKEDHRHSKYFGPFGSRKEALLILREIRKIVPFCSEPKLSNKPCLYSKINLCHPCPNYIQTVVDQKEKDYLTDLYKRNIRLVIKILSGKFSSITNDLKQKLKKAINTKNFEEAIKIREKLRLFQQITEKKSLSTDNEEFYHHVEDKLKSFYLSLKKYFPRLRSLFRIEGYDISNLNLRERAGSMVVFQNGYPDKSQYRRFKVNESRSDTYMIREIITRRLNNSWPLPDLMVIDGGIYQVKAAIEAVNKKGLKILIVGIAKNPDRLILPFDNSYRKIRLAEIPGNEILINLRNESHRFAKKYHLLLRHKNFLSKI